MLNPAKQMFRVAVTSLCLTTTSFATSVNLTADADVDIRSEISADRAFDRDVLKIKQFSTDPNFGESAKAYIRFALPADFGAATSATFEITRTKVGPWAWFYDVYGINDGLPGEFFTESNDDLIGITWNNAPANDPASTSTFLASDTTFLATWQVLKPAQGGVVGEKYNISGAALVDFLNTDTDGYVTLAIARNGVSTADDLWASKENATYGGPTLLLEYTPNVLDGDLNGDGFVGIADLNIVLGAWNQAVPPGNPLADPSGDGFVGIEDLNTVLGNWNAGTPPVNGAAVPEPATLGLLLIGVVAMQTRRAR